MGDELAKVIYFSVFRKTTIKNEVTIREETQYLLGFFFTIKYGMLLVGGEHAEKDDIDNNNCNYRNVFCGNNPWVSECQRTGRY